MCQLENYGTPASYSVSSLRITDFRGFSTRRNSVIFTGHLGTIPFTSRAVVMEYSCRDCLSEEIEILRLMFHRDEFLTLDPKACRHSGPLISKIEEDMKELSALDIQSAC